MLHTKLSQINFWINIKFINFLGCRQFSQATEVISPSFVTVYASFNRNITLCDKKVTSKLSRILERHGGALHHHTFRRLKPVHFTVDRLSFVRLPTCCTTHNTLSKHLTIPSGSVSEISRTHLTSAGPIALFWGTGQTTSRQKFKEQRS